MATELKNNSNKVAKWTAQAILAGAEQINLGFVSRASPKVYYWIFLASFIHLYYLTGLFQPCNFGIAIPQSKRLCCTNQFAS